MAGNCAIYRSWNTGDLLTASDLTTSFTTVGVTNMTQTCIDDYSVDVNQFRSNTDPYPGSVASLPTSGAQELERIRFVLKQITGFSQWYAHTEGLKFPTLTGDILLQKATPLITVDGTGVSSAFIKFKTNSIDRAQIGVASGETSLRLQPLANAPILIQPSTANNGELWLRHGSNSQNCKLVADSGGDFGVHTNDSLRWYFANTTGHLIPNQTNTYNIGQAANVVANIFSAIYSGSGTVAAAGAVRLANATNINWRNAANSADVGLGIDTNNNLSFTTNLVPSADNTFQIGTGSVRFTTLNLSTAVAIGTNPASAGSVRIASGQTMRSRNNANNADLDILFYNSSDQLVLGGSGGTIVPAADNNASFGTSALRWLTGIFSGSVQVGTNPAAAGAVRLANALNISGRNSGNSADVIIAQVDSSSRVRLGPQSAGNIRMDGQVRCDIDSTARLVLPVGADKWAV